MVRQYDPSIRCLAGYCAEVPREADVERLLDDAGEARRYRECLARHYVAVSPSVRWCPHPNCDGAVTLQPHVVRRGMAAQTSSTPRLESTPGFKGST